MSDDLGDSVVRMHDALSANGVAHALCGGVAANLYRDEVRATTDVDFMIELEAERLATVVEAIEASGWRAESYWKHGNQLRLSHASLARVDCIVAGTDLERTAIARAAIADVGGIPVPVLRPEDLIVLKLIAGRARDIDAVASILRSRREDLDLDYIEAGVNEYGAQDAWLRSLREADESS